MFEMQRIPSKVERPNNNVPLKICSFNRELITSETLAKELFVIRIRPSAFFLTESERMDDRGEEDACLRCGLTVF